MRRVSVIFLNHCILLIPFRFFFFFVGGNVWGGCSTNGRTAGKMIGGAAAPMGEPPLL